MNSFLTTLSSKGQVTLPKAIRESLILKTGDHLLLEYSSQGIFIKKAKISTAEEPLPEEEWNELKRLADQKGRVYKHADAFLKSLR